MGDSAITFEFGNQISESINRQVVSLFYHLRKLNLHGILDIIPAYCSITFVYDVLVVRKKTSGLASQFMREQVEEELKKANWNMELPSNSLEIPVCYDELLAPDLVWLAKEKKLSLKKFIQKHSDKTYRVHMIGFLPGFAYMGKVDKSISIPRKSKPAVLVKAGSVGIAGEQTGIYPMDSPGGWNIIGRTPLQLFNARKEEPVLLKAGDEVRFIPITLKEFHQFKSKV